MKKTFLLVSLLAIALSAFGQGTIRFSNRVTAAGTEGLAPVVAPIFGIDPANVTPS